MKKRGKDLEKLKYVVNELANQRPLDEKYRDHELTGNLLNAILSLIGFSFIE